MSNKQFDGNLTASIARGDRGTPDDMPRNEDLSASSGSFPDSPSTSTFLRTAETLDGLAEQLGALRVRTASYVSMQECRGCGRDRERMEGELRLSAEIGQALLERYEALVQKTARDKVRTDEKYNQLQESAANLERANTTHMQRYKEVTRANEALEKRLTQALHTQTLTQQSLTMVRTELTNLRTAALRQQADAATGRGLEVEISEMRDLKDAESQKVREEARKRKMAEGRVAALEEVLSRSKKEMQTLKEGRAKDAQDLLVNAKRRLDVLHSELSETFSPENPAGTPEFQKTLESLVASNALLKHDAEELLTLLADSREEIRVLREEAEGGRSDGAVLERCDPGHNRTSSTPIARHGRADSWNRYHMRKDSLTPSFASSGLGLGPIGDEEERVRTSPIGYQLNGIPKPPRRSYSERPKTARAFSGVAIAEWSGAESDEPMSPASEYPHHSITSPVEWKDSGAASDGGRISPGLAQGPSPAKERRVNRRTLLLLSRSRGVQTDASTWTQHNAGISPNPVASPNPAPSESSSVHERGALMTLVEHMTRILTRLRSADVPTLTKRLRKQHLPGDVGHLSQSTIKTLLAEVNDLRSQFRADDMHVSRKEFYILVKLLKDVFADLIEMQGIINDVTINPAVAKEMRAKAIAEEAKGGSWIAPITKFFVTPAEELPKPVERLQPPRMKQSPSTLATTTHVNVEFAGTGTVRRATSSARVPFHPPDLLSRAIPVARSNKEDLRGIFAGSVQPTFHGPLPAAGVSRLRSASSQHFKPAHRKRLSTVVDAVLDYDPSYDQSDEDDEDESITEVVPRQRPRGLSDSSIRSTFVSHGNTTGNMVPPAQRGVFENLTRKFSAFTGVDRMVSYTSTATGSSVPDTVTAVSSSFGGRASLVEDSKHA